MSDYQNPKHIANIGDVNFLEYGGRLVYFDDKEHEEPWMEVIEGPFHHEDERRWIVYRFDLERLKLVEHDGDQYLVPASWEPTQRVPYPVIYSAWFGKDLPQIASCMGTSVQELCDNFCSKNIVSRAWAWCAIGDYYGFEELDSYPLPLGVHEAFSRYGLQDECDCEACRGETEDED